MLIIKRNGTTEEYQIEKIVNAAKKAFDSCSDITYSQETLLNIAKDVEKIIINQSNTIDIINSLLSIYYLHY